MLKRVEAEKANKKVKYVEPVSYFSEETRRMFGLGEFAEKKTDTKTDTKKAPEKKADTKKK